MIACNQASCDRLSASILNCKTDSVVLNFEINCALSHKERSSVYYFVMIAW